MLLSLCLATRWRGVGQRFPFEIFIDVLHCMNTLCYVLCMSYHQLMFIISIDESSLP